MQIVATDTVGPFPKTDSGNVHVLVAADYFTRWAEAYAIPNQEAVTMATKLVDEMFCCFSVSEQLHSDQGRQFESARSDTGSQLNPPDSQKPYNTVTSKVRWTGRAF